MNAFVIFRHICQSAIKIIKFKLMKVLEAENRELRRDTQLADALAEARNSKKLESEAIMALRDLQKGLQANLR